MKLNLDLSEMMGSEVLVYFTFVGEKTIGKFSSRLQRSKAGQKVLFSVNADKAHLFDIDTGKTITN